MDAHKRKTCLHPPGQHAGARPAPPKADREPQRLFRARQGLVTRRFGAITRLVQVLKRSANKRNASYLRSAEETMEFPAIDQNRITTRQN